MSDNDFTGFFQELNNYANSPLEENTTTLQDVVKSNSMEDGYYVETDEHLKLEEIVLDMPEAMKYGLALELFNDELTDELFKCLAQLRAGKDSENLSVEIKNVLGRLIMQSTKNLQEEIEAIASGLK